MRYLGTCVVLAALAVLVATVALAGPPVPGNYTSTDMGGPINVGRYTEGWLLGGSAISAGTTLTAESWNGATLGTEWRYTCGTMTAAAILIFDNVNAQGFGNRTYMCRFVGGTIWLSGTGPWANGDPDYPGVIDSYVEYETVQYNNWVPVSAITNVQATAHFDAYPNACMAFSISNGSRVGTTDLGNVKPAGYPDLLAAGTCAPTMTHGAWWNMMTLTLSISPSCATPTRAATWGSLKTMYR
jgi:hypothetical protein